VVVVIVLITLISAGVYLFFNLDITRLFSQSLS